MGEDVILIDSARETAIQVKKYLDFNAFVDEDRKGTDLFEVTDLPQRFMEVGEIFLGRELENVQHVTLVEGDEESYISQLISQI